MHTRNRAIALTAAAVLTAGVVAGAGSASAATSTTMDELVPQPVSVQEDPAATFTLSASTTITAPLLGEAHQVAELLASELRPATGFRLPVLPAPLPSAITLRLTHDDGDHMGAEGYRLSVTDRSVTLEATTPDGLRNGVQTVRQLLPAQIEQRTVQPGPWTIPGGHVLDRPRYAYRGAMLDVARFFYPVDFVKQYIDDLSFYKINHLHLHLTDDQGWRLQIDGWPRLATYGGSTQTGGGPGGYYTKAQYRDLVRYADDRGVTIVPEVDLPGHASAALASYAELNCDGVAPPLYTGYNTGFSSLCLTRQESYEMAADVIDEVARMTPGDYIDIGGDEVPPGVDPADFTAFMKAAAAVAAKHHKKVLGWNDVLKALPGAGVTAQYWYPWTDDANAVQAAKDGAKFVMSPANHAYLDAKYTETVPQYGQVWAGLVEARDAYSWDPDTAIDGVGGSSVLGVEATMFTQATPTQKDVEFMTFPRLPELAEVGWTPKDQQSFDTAAPRLAAQGKRWDIWGVNYYASPQIPW